MAPRRKNNEPWNKGFGQYLLGKDLRERQRIVDVENGPQVQCICRSFNA
jgi:hypothetical protein